MTGIGACIGDSYAIDFIVDIAQLRLTSTGIDQTGANNSQDGNGTLTTERVTLRYFF